MKEKYLIEQTEEGYKISYYIKDRFVRSFDYFSGEYVAMLCQRFLQESPRGKVIFLRKYDMPRPSEFDTLERKVRK